MTRYIVIGKTGIMHRANERTLSVYQDSQTHSYTISPAFESDTEVTDFVEAMRAWANNVYQEKLVRLEGNGRRKHRKTHTTS